MHRGCHLAITSLGAARLRESLAYNAADLWSADSSGKTCLHLAASRGNVALLTHLLSLVNGTDMLEAVDNDGCTILHYAVRSRQVVVLELLLNRGVDINVTDRSARNVMHHVARWRNVEALRKLNAVTGSRSLLTPDKNGRFPYQMTSLDEALRRQLVMDSGVTLQSKDTINSLEQRRAIATTSNDANSPLCLLLSRVSGFKITSKLTNRCAILALVLALIHMIYVEMLRYRFSFEQVPE